MGEPVFFLCRRKCYSGGKPIKFKKQRTQRGGKLGWCEGTFLSSWCLQAVKGKDNSPLFVHFTLIYFCISC